MEDKLISRTTRKTDVPYDAANPGEVSAFWEIATKHRGVEQLRAKRGRPPKAETDRKEQFALRLDGDARARYQGFGARWQTRMNAVLKACRDATV